MSELIITPKNIKEIELYKNADSYLIGNDSFCVRYNSSYSNEEIINAQSIIKKMKKNLYINVNKIFQEVEIKALKEYMLFLKEINVDGIFFSDFAVLQIAKELNIENKCVLYHETYPTNTNDLEVLLSFNLKGIIMSKEVEIETLINATKFDNVGMTAFGHIEIFHSKRRLIETYSKQYNLKEELVNNYNVHVKEMTRDNLYPLYQDKNGTIIFSDYVLCSAKYIKGLIEKGLDTIWIDGLFLPLDYQLDILKLYANIDKLNENEINNFIAKYTNIPHGDEVLLKEDTII